MLRTSQHSSDPQGQTRCALAVMTKAPRAGQVKTRLTPPLTQEEAAALNRCFLCDIAAAISITAEQRNARGIAVYTPVGAEEEYERILTRDFQLLPQRGKTLDEKLINASKDLLQLGFPSFCFVGSDSPTVPLQVLAEAMERLSQTDDSVVLGPTADGGYYLIGLKKLHLTLFEDIDWSTDRVLEQTIGRAEKLRIRIQLLPAWYDVDDRATLHRLCEEFFGSNENRVVGYPAPVTRGYLENLLSREGRERIWPTDKQVRQTPG